MRSFVRACPYEKCSGSIWMQLFFPFACILCYIKASSPTMCTMCPQSMLCHPARSLGSRVTSTDTSPHRTHVNSRSLKALSPSHSRFLSPSLLLMTHMTRTSSKLYKRPTKLTHRWNDFHSLGLRGQYDAPIDDTGNRWFPFESFHFISLL